MGSTKCKGGSLQDVLQLNQNQLPKPQRITYTVIQCYNNEIYNNTRYTDYTLGPSMPQVAFTPLGLPLLAI